MAVLTDQHLAGLLAVRSSLASFQRISDREARAVGTTHAQQHVMLTLGGGGDQIGSTVKEVAEALAISSPSAVELITRMVTARLLERRSDAADARVTRLRLTPLGNQLMHQLGEGHLPRLRHLTARAVDYLAE